AEDNIIPSRTIADHCNRISDLFFNKFNIITTVFRQLLILLYAADITFPSRKGLEHRFCFLKKMRNREIRSYLSVNFIPDTYRDLIQVAKYVQNRKRNICCS